MALHTAKIYTTELKSKNINVNKGTCSKNLQPKKFQTCSQKQNTNNHINHENSKVNKDKYKCGNISYLAKCM